MKKFEKNLGKLFFDLHAITFLGSVFFAVLFLMNAGSARSDLKSDLITYAVSTTYTVQDILLMIFIAAFGFGIASMITNIIWKHLHKESIKENNKFLFVSIILFVIQLVGFYLYLGLRI